MSGDNDLSNFSESTDELTRSPESSTQETTDTINDQDVTNLIAHDADIIILTTPTGNDGSPIEVGDAQPTEEVNQPAFVINHQPLDERHQEAADVLRNLPSPINLYIDNDYQIPLSTDLQIVPIHVNIADDDIELIERTTSAEPEQHDSDDIHIEQTERTAIEPVESPVRHEHINHQIHNRPGESIDVIDLTQDSDEDSNHPDASEIHSNGVVSPVTIDLTTEADNEVEVIDLTGDNDEQEGPIQMTSNTADNEQMNRSETDPPIMPITEQVALAAVSSSEATDQNILFATATDHHHHTIETTARIQVPRLQSRNKKRSISSDEIRRDVNQHLPGEVKRVRYTIL